MLHIFLAKDKVNPLRDTSKPKVISKSRLLTYEKLNLITHLLNVMFRILNLLLWLRTHSTLKQNLRHKLVSGALMITYTKIRITHHIKLEIYHKITRKVKSVYKLFQ